MCLKWCCKALFWGALWQWCIGVLTKLKTLHESFSCQVLTTEPWLPSGPWVTRARLSVHMSDGMLKKHSLPVSYRKRSTTAQWTDKSCLKINVKWIKSPEVSQSGQPFIILLKRDNNLMIDTLRLKQNGRYFSDCFQIHFLVFDSNSSEVCA